MSLLYLKLLAMNYGISFPTYFKFLIFGRKCTLSSVFFLTDRVIGKLGNIFEIFKNFVKQAHLQVNLICLTFLHKKELEEN